MGRIKCFTYSISVLICLFVSCNSGTRPIKPYHGNPFYWQYKVKPLLLAGASNDDNLFQYPGLKQHLDSLHAISANYIRNTMSERQIRGHEVSAFAKQN